MAHVKLKLVRIGNSRGVRIPKPLLEQCGFGSTVELEIRERTLVLHPAKARAGWEDAFEKVAQAGGDDLIETPAPTWDHDEWRW